MSTIKVSAKTKDEAITKALIQLGITSDRLDYNVIVEGKMGLFGIGAKPWIIEASVKESLGENELTKLEKDIDKIKANTSTVASKNSDSNVNKSSTEKKSNKKSNCELNDNSTNVAFTNNEKHQKTERKPRKHDKQFSRNLSDSFDTSVDEKKQHEIKPITVEEAEEAIHDAEQFITNVLKGMNMDVNTKSKFDHSTNELLINLEGSDMGVLIGKRGQTLDSLQYLTSLVVNKNHKEDYIRIKLDTEDYRSRREATLRNLARNIAYKVRRTRKAVALEPMNPYERRIIHSALQNDRFVTTKSEGEEPFRHVIIFMKRRDKKSYSRDDLYSKKDIQNTSTDIDVNTKE
ncbi:RNA-binding cell elongation regulator Jag/EloR [Oribacterium sp. WCC10]|uniref:RNA-binding cell elongation regulator Jag/EloR n=1 Tax=Oribacterium sp. WCC10 TaxID=1855343 RepID=UPI0008EBECCC|nr:RNA-binding cell elongation regulator Jag/EloR [Oribacterium sp. WCC10]SFG72287.1 spoIIIJ-associated protein [Oribacterium sp. WCC10]